MKTKNGRRMPMYHEGEKLRGVEITGVFFIAGKYKYKFKGYDLLVDEEKIKP